MSEAMVNIRATVSKAIAERVIRPDSGERVIRCAKDTFYQERSLTAAIAEAWGGNAYTDERTRFLHFIERGGYVNQKRLDALALVRHLAGLRPMPVRPGHGAVEVHRSSFILKLQHDVMCGPFDELDTDLPREERVAAKAVQLGPTFHLLQRLAKLMAVSHALARSRGVVATPQARARVYQRHDFGLGPAARTRRWAEAHDMDAAARAQFIDRLSVIGGFLEASATRNGKRGGGRHLDAYLLTLMRLDDRYRAWRPRGTGTGARADRAVLRSAAQRSGQEFGLYRRLAALWSAVDPIVVTRGIKPQGTPQFRSDEFRRARGLERQDATRAWQRANNLDANGYMTLVEQHARLSVPCDGTEARTLGLFHLTDPACWLLDAIRLTGHYVELKRRVYHGPAQPGPAGNRSRRNEMAKARTTKAAPKKAAVKDLAPKNPKAVKGGLLKKKVYE